MPAASLIDLYDRLANAPDDRTRARVIAEAFEALEMRYPHLPDLATRQHLSETELRLVREIEQVRAEIKETEKKLQLEIEKARGEIKETEKKLLLEIEQVRGEIKETEKKLLLEIEKVRSEIKETEKNLAIEIARVQGRLLQWSFVFWLTQFAAILALIWRLWPTGQPG